MTFGYTFDIDNTMAGKKNLSIKVLSAKVPVYTVYCTLLDRIKIELLSAAA